MSAIVHPCNTCRRIRLFVMVTWPLVALIWVQPEGAQRLAALIPSPLALGILIAGTGAVVFLGRLVRFIGSCPRA